MIKNTLKIMFAIVAATGNLYAQGSDQPAKVAIEGSETRIIQSEIMDQNFRLLIGKPLGPPPNADGTYPTIYLLDADLSFPLVRQIALSLQSDFSIPPALIVGIAYEGGFREAMTARTRDYTPTVYDAYAEYAARWEGGTGESDTTGGATDFLRFIREELKPFIELNYSADTEDSTLFGSSFGGLFAAYTLLAHSDTFHRYVISSPSLWWDNDFMFAMENQYAQENSDLPAIVFIGAGGRETAAFEDEMLAQAPPQARAAMHDFIALIGENLDMVKSIEAFVEALEARGYENLDLTFHVFPDDTHASTPPLTITRGLRVVFGGL